MEFLFSKYQAKKLQPCTLCIFKIMESSYNNVYCGACFYRSRAYSIRNNYSRQLRGEPVSVLKKDSKIVVFLGNFEKYSEQLYFQKTNGQLLPKIQVAFFLKIQRTSVAEQIGNYRK